MEHFWDIKDLTVSYKTMDGKAVVVDGVSLYVDSGEVIGVVGESGSGKSQTQLSALQLIPMPPGKIESGKVLLDGENLLDHAANSGYMRDVRGGRVGMIFQEPMTSLNPVKTIASQRAALQRHKGAGSRPGGGAAGSGWHPRRCQPSGRLSPPVLRRHAPKDHDRHGDGGRTGDDHRRRAHHGA